MRLPRVFRVGMDFKEPAQGVPVPVKFVDAFDSKSNGDMAHPSPRNEATYSCVVYVTLLILSTNASDKLRTEVDEQSLSCFVGPLVGDVTHCLDELLRQPWVTDPVF